MKQQQCDSVRKVWIRIVSPTQIFVAMPANIFQHVETELVLLQIAQFSQI